jgi:hypothetical protein
MIAPLLTKVNEHPSQNMHICARAQAEGVHVDEDSCVNERIDDVVHILVLVELTLAIVPREGSTCDECGEQVIRTQLHAMCQQSRTMVQHEWENVRARGNRGKRMRGRLRKRGSCPLYRIVISHRSTKCEPNGFGHVPSNQLRISANRSDLRATYPISQPRTTERTIS